MRTDNTSGPQPIRGPAPSAGQAGPASPNAPDEALGTITLIAARRWQPTGLAWLMLFTCLAVIAGWSMLPGASMGDHECYVAQTSREMLQTGDWVVPRFSGMPRIQKGPLAYWCVAALSDLVGKHNDHTVRLPSAFAGLALAALMALFARRVFGATSLAWFAAAVMGFSAAWLYHTHNGTVDMQLTFWCTLAGVLFWLGVNNESRGWRIALFAGMGAALGVAMLAKVPLPLLILPPGFLLYLVATGRTRRISQILLECLPGIAVMLAIFLPWVLAVLGRLDGAAVGAKWYREIFTHLDGDGGTAGQAWYYYLPLLLGMVLPWTLSLPEALAAPWLSRYKPWRDVLVLAFCLATANFVLFSLASYKREHYLLPAIPWFVLLLTPPVWRFFAGPIYEHPRLFARVGLVLAVVALVGGGAGFLLVRQQAPSLAGPFTVPIGILAVGLSLTGLVMAVRARIEAVYVLLLTLTVTFCFGWSRTVYSWGGAAQEKQFAAAFRRIVPPDAAGYYLQRPSPRLVYYGNLPLPRVLSDLQLSQRIQERNLPDTVDNRKRLTAQALMDLLAADKPVYVVGEYWHWQELQSIRGFEELGAKIVYRQPNDPADPARDPIILANRAAPVTSQPVENGAQ